MLREDLRCARFVISRLSRNVSKQLCLEIGRFALRINNVFSLDDVNHVVKDSNKEGVRLVVDRDISMKFDEGKETLWNRKEK